MNDSADIKTELAVMKNEVKNLSVTVEKQLLEINRKFSVLEKVYETLVEVRADQREYKRMYEQLIKREEFLVTQTKVDTLWELRESMIDTIKKAPIIWAALWGTISFIVVAVGTAIISLVIKN